MLAIRETNASRVDAALGAEQVDMARGFDHGYFPLQDAHLWTTARLTGKPTTRFYVSIVIAADADEFSIEHGDCAAIYRAAAIKARTQCGKRNGNGPLLTVHLDPLHRHFRAFHSLPDPGVLALDRNLFSPLDAQLRAACAGMLSLDASAQLIDAVVAKVVALLPKPKSIDTRIGLLVDMLRHDPNISLSDLAIELGLSYDRMSHLFTDAIGLPFRSYRLWRKVRRANLLLWSGKSLTEAAHSAGFTDSAHLSRTFQNTFGRPPSFFFCNSDVKIHAPLSLTEPTVFKRQANRSRELSVTPVTPL